MWETNSGNCPKDQTWLTGARDLNTGGRLLATDDDVEAALDGTFDETNLFDALRRQRDEADGDTSRDPTLKALVREHHVDERDARLVVAVPMFATWIREHA